MPKMCHWTEETESQHLILFSILESTSSKKYFMMVKSCEYRIQRGQVQESSSSGLEVTWWLTSQPSHRWSCFLSWVTSTVISWWLSEPSQLKTKAGSIWKISLLLFLVAPAFSIWILVIQRWWWEKWAADEEKHLWPAQFEKEKVASPVLVMEYPLPLLAKAKLERGRSHRRDGETSARRVNPFWSPGVSQMFFKIAKLWRKFQPSS